MFDSVTPWTAVRQAFLPFTISQSLLKLMFTESRMPSNHLILCHPLLFLPSIFPSIRVFSNDLAVCIKVTTVLELQIQHQSFSEYSRLISFRIDWFDLLAVQGTHKCLLQHHNLKAFFMVQLSTTNSMLLLPLNGRVEFLFWLWTSFSDLLDEQNTVEVTSCDFWGWVIRNLAASPRPLGRLVLQSGLP